MPVRENSLHMEHLFAYNPTLGGEADPENKILFFHPADTPLADQVRYIGLSEALSSFALNLCNASDSEVLHTQNRRYVFLQVELEIWFVVVARNRDVQAANVTQAESEGHMQDSHLKNILCRIYGMLRMFCGPLRAILGRRGPQALREQLSPFLMRQLELGSEDAFHASDILNAMDGIRFLPVDQRLYLRAQYVVNLVECTHPSVHNCMLLHHDKLVWSGFTHAATRLLHRYLTNGLLGTQSHAGAPPSPSDLAGVSDHLFGLVLAQIHQQQRTARPTRVTGSFLCGAGDPLQDGRSAVRVPAVLVETRPPQDSCGQASRSTPTTQLHEGWYRLVVFRTGHTSLVLLVDEEPALWSQPVWYQQLAALLGTELQPLSVQLTEQHTRLQAVDDPHQYLYFNRLNLAIKSSISVAGPKLSSVGALPLSNRFNAILSRMHADLGQGDVREAALKTTSDGWLVGRLSGSREFYMLFDSKYTNFSEVHREVVALGAVHFSNIFLD